MHHGFVLREEFPGVVYPILYNISILFLHIIILHTLFCDILRNVLQFRRWFFPLQLQGKIT